jgi:serine/threonine protein phosphatase PrpC
VDDRLSGTTAITAGFHFGRLTVCNVGDSRAVMGHRVSGSEEEEEKTEIGHEPVSSQARKLVAVPLSRDQTPFRADERERVKKAGADVMTVEQMNGYKPRKEDWDDVNLGQEIDENGDPPRVWVKGKDYPGCAFTRSLGDLTADRIGVWAEPEMLTKELTGSDEILVIASDGIFEFITNQGVIDMCSECDSPLEACEQLVKASYSQWLQFEDRTDDMTVIVCFLQCDSKTETSNGTAKELVASSHSASARPIRKIDRKTDGISLSLFVPKDGEEALQRRVLEDWDASSEEHC